MKKLLNHNLSNGLLFICALLVTFASCKKRSALQVEVVKLLPDKEMDMLSDSTFFEKVNCIVEYDGDIYLSLDQRMQIVRLDKDFNLKETVGMSGRGPQEFQYIKNIFVDDDVIWVGDVGKFSYMRFSTDGEFINTVKRSKGRYSLDNRFQVEDRKIYFSKRDLDKKTSLALLDLNKNDGADDFRQFGEFTEFTSETKTLTQNQRDVFVYNDELVVVPHSIPAIEKYDKNTLELTQRFDATVLPLIKERHDTFLKDQAESLSNTAHRFVFDSYLKDSLLYVMYMVKAPNENEYPLAMVFDISGEIKYVKQYLTNELMRNICITDDYIYASSFMGGVVKRYPLK